jgi:hypothetical protein
MEIEQVLNVRQEFLKLHVLTVQAENKPRKEGKAVTYNIMCSTIQM